MRWGGSPDTSEPCLPGSGSRTAGRDQAITAGWQQAIAFVEAAALAIGLQLDRRAAEYAPWHPGRCAEFTVPTGEAIGYAGELHPEVCAAFGLPARTAAAEIDLDALIAAAPAIG